ncbi:hypothetical protein TTHERM_00197740 (macronuclear) [Tetrahymena thermophila SB210]|uniref:Uncharacterized protein n=1 Tax=Tetrahymena thermophila (strain SB210) TaxID=312017 RepID=Q22NS5_TETTS|nr:hypothetical protein TTHERM_00197740 [Tetrahymena thermophila SB210]EAR86710.2 hypothetical protein TTHERM_00197740 [Tetrahymena thermophila SB210]|eukprot:XP_977305.2 hypothetical protein TTHERM_00197740 [Tetrahymena thermophila SB210]
MGKPLSEDLIKQKTRQDSLQMIRNLNLWGQDIDDLKVLRNMPNLEVLSLSVNKITTLKDIEYCHKLQELYLRKNSIADISEIKYLSQLKQLKVLWLSDNPCASIPNYREIVIKSLPYLEKLDNVNITPEDKMNCQNIELDFMEEVANNNNVGSSTSNNNRYSSYQNQPQQQQQQQYNPSPMNRMNDYNTYQENNNYSQQYQQSSATRASSNNYNTRNNNPSTVQQNNNQQTNYEEVQQMNNVSQIDDQLVNRNSNIVCAILSLLKELDYNSLEIIRRDVDRKINSAQRYQN